MTKQQVALIAETLATRKCNGHIAAQSCAHTPSNSMCNSHAATQSCDDNREHWPASATRRNASRLQTRPCETTSFGQIELLTDGHVCEMECRAARALTGSLTKTETALRPTLGTASKIVTLGACVAATLAWPRGITRIRKRRLASNIPTCKFTTALTWASVH